MRQSLGSRAVVLAAACAITTAACDNRHLVGDADAGSTGAAGTGMTGAAGTVPVAAWVVVLAEAE